MTKTHFGPGPATVMCTYRVKSDREKEFVGLLEKHWPTLKKLGLVTDEPSRVYRGEDDEKKPYFVEIFAWKDGQAPGRAHELPDVMSVWEPMGACTESRGGRPPMEFPHVQSVTLRLAQA